MTHPHYVFWLVLTTFFWGGSFIFNKIGFREIPPVLFLFLRFSLATLLMGLFCARRLRQLNRETVRKGVIVGLALAATNLTFVLGVSGTSATRAGFLNNLFVLNVPLISYLLWRERLERVTLVGVVIASAGLWFMAQGGVEGFNRGDVLSTVCSLFIALHIITVSRVLRDEDIFLVSLVQFATVAVVGGVVTAIVRPVVTGIGVVSWGALLYCVVFPTVVCFTLQNRYQRFTTPTQAGLIYTLDPVWSMLGGMLVLGERLTVREWYGCLLILAAVAGPLLMRLVRERKRRNRYLNAADITRR
jgi:drug/metabolite transporter (DMT)-like permease